MAVVALPAGLLAGIWKGILALYCSSQVRVLHLELTTRCNAACPMCARTAPGGRVNPKLPLTELSLDDISTILPESFVRQLDQIYLCGNYGDPIAANDTIEILEYFRAANPSIELGMHTNGSARTASWWERLAKSLDYCRFGIDGLQETNSIYRRNTSFARILDSIRSFVEGGGRGEWDFLVFKHNEHEVEAAQSLARDLGLVAFNIKPTSRFLSHETGTVSDKFPILDELGRTIFLLEPSTNPKWRNTALDEHSTVNVTPESYRKYLQHTEIKCKAANNRSIYITAEGLLAPCCWLGSFYRPHDTSKGDEDFLTRIGGHTDPIDLRSHSIESIIDGPIFQKTIPGSWAVEQEGSRRIEHCARICGTRNFQGAQHASNRPELRMVLKVQ